LLLGADLGFNILLAHWAQSAHQIALKPSVGALRVENVLAPHLSQLEIAVLLENHVADSALSVAEEQLVFFLLLSFLVFEAVAPAFEV